MKLLKLGLLLAKASQKKKAVLNKTAFFVFYNKD